MSPVFIRWLDSPLAIIEAMERLVMGVVDKTGWRGKLATSREARVALVHLQGGR